VSEALVEQVLLSSNCQNSTRLVHLVLAHLADENGRCDPKLSELQWLCRLSKSAVLKAVESLRRNSYIDCEYDRKDGRKIYIVKLPAGAEVAS
jgi:DNA-binding MarR family transcriptional regulator